MNAFAAAPPLDIPDQASVDLLAAPVRVVDDSAAQAVTAEPPAHAQTQTGGPALAQTAEPALAVAEAPARAAGEAQPPLEAAAAGASLPRTSGTRRSAFAIEMGAMSQACAAISSGLFTLGGLAVRMARSLRAGSARW